MTQLNIKPLSKICTLKANVVEQLREAIINGDIPPRTKLIETQLSKTLGVSRGPLREAIQQLVEQGLIESIPYVGTYVTDITVKKIQELYSFRTEIERFAFSLIWKKRTQLFYENIKIQHDRLTQAIKEKDSTRTIFEELELHSVVYNHCGHELLKENWQRLKSRLHLYFTLHQKAHNRSGPKINAHDTYVKLATSDDLNAMLSHVSEHMNQGYSKVEKYVHLIEQQLK